MADAAATKPSTQDFSEGWVLFVGALIALAAVREAVRRIAAQPFIARAKSPSRTDLTMGIFLAKNALERLGSWALRAPPRTG